MKAKTPTAEQTLLSGVLTEADVVKAFLRRIASKGGSVTNPKKAAASRRNAKLALAARMAKRAEEAKEQGAK